MFKGIVEYVKNGFLIIEKTDCGEEKYVYEIADSNLPEENREGFVNVLWHLTDFFGQGGSKHDKKRIRITYESQED